MYDYPMTNGYSWGWGFVMALFWLLILAFGAFIVVRLLRSHEAGHNVKASPLDIAKERYAKGEITQEQYEQLKKELK